MIDMSARNRIIEDNRMKSLISGLGQTLGEALTQKKILEKDSEGFNLNVKFKDEGHDQITSSLDKIGKALVVIYNRLTSFRIDLPKIFKVEGSVDVDNVADLPPVHIQNFKDLKPYFESLEKSLKYLSTAITLAASKEPVIQKSVPTINFDTKPLLNALQEIKDVSNKPVDNKQMINMLRNISEGIGALIDKPTFVPPAVTNITLNPLQGFVKTTSATIGTTITSLPSYGQLFNRRAVIIYNNSSNTIYLGGVDVTTSNGLPVPANSYSPILDAGYNMIVYGIASVAGNNVRILEVSKDQTANVQE